MAVRDPRNPLDNDPTAATKLPRYKPSRPTDVQRSLVADMDTTGLVRKSVRGGQPFAIANKDNGMPTPAPQEPTFIPPPSRSPDVLTNRSAEAAGLSRVVKLANGVYTNDPAAGRGAGADVRYYDAMGSRADRQLSDADLVGLKNTREFAARESAAPRLSDAQILDRGRTTLSLRRRIDNELAAQQAAQQEMQTIALTKTRPPSEADIAKTTAEAARAAAQAGQIGAQTVKTQVDAAGADAENVRLARAEANARADEVFSAQSQAYTQNPQAVRERWGDGVTPAEAAGLDTLTTLIQMGRNPYESDAGRIGISALIKLLSGASRNNSVLDAFAYGDELFPNQLPPDGQLDPTQFTLEDPRSTIETALSPGAVRVGYNGSSPRTFIPSGSQATKDNLRMLIESLRAYRAPE